MKKENIPLRHRVYLAVSALEVVFFSCTMLGWSSLLFLLKNEGFFHELCETDFGENSSLPVPSFGRVSSGSCVAQEERYSLVVTLSSGFGNGFSVMFGLAIDKLGAKKVQGIASIVYGLSTLLFAVATKETSYLLFPAALLCQTAGQALFFCACRATLVFGKWQSTVMAFINGANIASAITFLIFKILYENFGIAYHFLFYALSACAVVLLVSTYLLFPTMNETADQLGREPISCKEEVKPLKRKDAEEKEKVPKGKDDEVPVWKLVLSGGVVWSIVLMGICRLRLWFFTASFHHLIGSLPGASETTVATYADIYGVCQLCAILCGPLLGLAIAAGKRELRTFSALSRRYHTFRKNLVRWGKSQETQRSHDVSVQKVSADQHVGSVVMAEIREIRGCQVSVVCTVVTLIVFGISALIPNTLVQILTFSMIVSMRVFNQGAVTNLILVMYPTKHFGKLYGIIQVSVSVISFLQYPIFVMMESYFTGNPFWANVLLLIISVAAVGLPIYLNSYMNRLQSLTKGQRLCDTECVWSRETEAVELVTVV